MWTVCQPPKIYYDCVAQWLRRVTVNHKIVSSILTVVASFWSFARGLCFYLLEVGGTSIFVFFTSGVTGYEKTID